MIYEWPISSAAHLCLAQLVTTIFDAKNNSFEHCLICSLLRKEAVTTHVQVLGKLDEVN